MSAVGRCCAETRLIQLTIEINDIITNQECINRSAQAMRNIIRSLFPGHYNARVELI